MKVEMARDLLEHMAVGGGAPAQTSVCLASWPLACGSVPHLVCKTGRPILPQGPEQENRRAQQ